MIANILLLSFLSSLTAYSSANMRNFPVSQAVVSIENFRGLHICNGILVSSDVILTAAHCVNDIDSHLTVRINSKVSGFGGEAIAVRKNCPITGYDFPTRKNDIAILRLASSSVGVVPAKLPNDDTSSNAVPLAHGWGFNTEGYVQAFRVAAVSDAECKADYGNAIHEGMECLRYLVGFTSCLDSAQGAPVLVDDTVVSINAAVGACRRTQGPHGVFTKIPKSIQGEIDKCV